MFSLLCHRRSSCWKYWKWCSYFENRYHHPKVVEKKIINFSVSPYCTQLFSRKENIKSSEVALVAVHCNSWSATLWLPDSQPWNTTNTIGNIYLLVKSGNYNTGLIIKCGRAIHCRLASVFLKNLEHLWYSILVSLF